MRQRRLAWTAVASAAVLAAAARWRLLDAPLERDEGGYAYAGQLILQGVPPYAETYHVKLPGIDLAYALVLALLGESPRGIHLGLLLVNAATSVLVFLLGRRLLGDLLGAFAAATFALLSLGQSLSGVFANAEHFLLLPAVGGLVLLLRALDTGRLAPLVGSGLLLGAAFLVKQQGAAFAALAGLTLALELLRRGDPRRAASHCALFALAAATPYLVTCVALFLTGVFPGFWAWTVVYARAYSGQTRFDPTWLLRQFRAVAGAAPSLWILAGLGLAAIWWLPAVRGRRAFLALLVLASAAAVSAGLFFRPHYFLLALPAASLLAAGAVGVAAALLRGARSPALRLGVPAGLALASLALPLGLQRDFLFRQTPAEVTRSTYGQNPFVESLEIARFVAEHTAPHERVAVLGSEPQIFFYARRRSATGYIYSYPLMETHQFALAMQEDMIREIEAAEPAALVFVNLRTSWLRRGGSELRIFEWFEDYRQRFDLAGVVDLQPDGTRYYFGDELGRFEESAEPLVEIYLRRR